MQHNDRERCAAPAADRCTGRTESRTEAAELHRHTLTARRPDRPQRAAGAATEPTGRRFSKLLRIIKEDPARISAEDPGHGAQLIGADARRSDRSGTAAQISGR